MQDRYRKTEIAAGLFVIFGAVALGYLSISIGGVDLFRRSGIEVTARFASIGDLKANAPIKVAGVNVGRVRDIRLSDYAAEVVLEIDAALALPTDTIASIRTEGLLGESYVLLRPGADDRDLASGDRIQQTEPAIDLIDMIVKYALEKEEEQ